MVIDASVWVSWLISGDTHHLRAAEWLETRMATGQLAPVIPSLALPEVAGSIARRTGVTELGELAAETLLAVPRLRVIPIDVQLAAEAARTAAQLRLRGGDALYAVVAHAFALTLVTFDRQLAERAGAVVEVIEP